MNRKTLERGQTTINANSLGQTSNQTGRLANQARCKVPRLGERFDADTVKKKRLAYSAADKNTSMSKATDTSDALAYERSCTLPRDASSAHGAMTFTLGSVWVSTKQTKTKDIYTRYIYGLSKVFSRCLALQSL